jgi:Co/Zn/Cd efflux system component
MSKHTRWDPSNREDKHYYELAASLSNGPLTFAEIEDSYSAYYRLLGMFAWQLQLSPVEQAQRKNYLVGGLDELLRREWITFDGMCYSLTPAGRIQAEKMLEHIRMARGFLDTLQTPETVSKVSLAIYIALALVKLPAGLLSGSVGLINDSFDTLLDGLCSLLVYLGIRFQKERLVNTFQVLMLLVAGCLTLYQAVMGLLKPHAPEVDLFTFLAALLSALACAGLFFYQRSVGLKHGNLGLITQSVDSRNHVIVAIGVTLGLVAALLKFSLLDALVGLVVAGLILKSAVEMTIELFRSFNQAEELDLSNYRISIPGLEQRQRNQLCDWMLYLVQQKIAHTKGQLLALVENTIATSNPVLQTFGFADENSREESPCSTALQRAIEQGWILLEPPVELTPAGQEHLAKQLARYRKQHGHRRMLSV